MRINWKSPRALIARTRIETARAMLLACLGLLSASGARAQEATPTLDIYYVDVEGGAATLIVSPQRETLLVDTGWPGNNGRDAERIVQAMTRAGVKRIDHLITTHYHTDHYGGVPALAARVPIGRFHDHGPMERLDEDHAFAEKYAAYVQVAKNRHTLVPGQLIDLRGAPAGPALTLRVIAARGKTLPAANGTPNSLCDGLTRKPDDPSDNARSVGFVLSYGSFDFFDAGDLTWNVEAGLACPSNVVGAVDLYQVTHHGLDTSNNTVLLRSLAPRVAVMNNGPRKGGTAPVVRALRELPSLEALYAVHRNVATGPEDNAAPELTANLDETPDEGHMISVHVHTTGAFDVVNHRTGARRTFRSR